MDNDSEYLLLSTIKDLTGKRTDISQRDLSRAINLSLGMTNVLLKRLSQKGLILIQKASSRTVSYILTPDGMNELGRRTYRYLKSTLKTVVLYKEQINSITRDAKSRGILRVGLLGKSDIDFIIEYAAHHNGLPFERYDKPEHIPQDTFVFVSENMRDEQFKSSPSIAHIASIISGE